MARPRDTSIDAAVVTATVELLGEVGRHGLTRQQIAARAGVSLPAVTRRFASVDEVLLAVSRTPGRAPLPDATSLRDYCVTAVRHAVRVFAEPGTRRAATEMLAAAAGDDRIDAAFNATLARQRAEGVAWVRDAVAKGELPADTDPGTLMDALTGSIYYRLLWRGEAITTEEVEPLVDFVLRGAGAAPA